jgi:hypothetical protein
MTLEEIVAKMTPEARAKQDRRYQLLTAVHEAGHVVVGASYGLGVRAWIERDATRKPFERQWTGTARHSLRNYFTGKTLRPSKGILTQIGVAGMTAETIHDEKGDPDASNIMDAWREGWGFEPSDADVAMMSKSWKRRLDAIEKVIVILCREQRFLDAVVAALIEDGEMTDGQIGELAAELLVMPASDVSRRL